MNHTMENFEYIVDMIRDELERAERKFPDWPEDIIHAAAIVQEECGELIRASLNYYYGKSNIKPVFNEAIQAGAMCVRFLLNSKTYYAGDATSVPNSDPKK